MRRGICKMARMGTVLFIAALMLTSCAKKPQDISQEENEDNLVYSAQYTRVMDYIDSAMFAFDADKDTLIINCRTDEDYRSSRKLMSLSLDDMQLQEVVDGTDVEEYSSFVKSGDYYYAARDGASGVEIVKLDDNFAEVDSVTTVISSTYSMPWTNPLAADSEGRLYIMSSSEIQVFDSEFNELCSIEISGNIYGGIAVCGDKAYTIVVDGLTSILSEIDVKTQSLVRVNGSLPGNYRAFCGTDGKIYIAGMGTIYEYDIAADSLSTMLSLIEYGVDGYSVTDMYVGENDSIVLIIDESYVTPGDYALGIEVLSKVPADSLPPRQKITVAAYASDSYYMEEYIQFIRFMRANPEYTIVFENYNDDYTDSISFDEFNKMLISGIDADIFLFSDYDTDMIKNMADKGILYDLDNFISTDAELKNALIPNVHEKLKYNDGLYGISAYCSVSTLTGRKSVVGDRAGWNVQKITEMLENDEDLTLFASGDAADTLSTLIYSGVCMDEDFIRNEGFDSERFIELLELCKLCGIRNKNADRIVVDAKAIVDGRAMVVNDYNTFGVVRDYYALYGDEEFVRIGYPDEAGGRSVMKWWNMLCISNSSENKDAAWELVRSFLSSDYYENVHNSQPNMYPVVQRECEKRISDELENQNTQTVTIFSVDDNLNVIDERYIDAPMIDSEQAGIIMDEINTASLCAYDIDRTIADIIFEEAAYYFEGQKTAGEVGKIIQDRVQLYLDEKD